MKRKPSAIELLILSVLLWSIPLLIMIGAAIGDCFGPNCPTDAQRMTLVIIAALIVLVLQIGAAVWYARAHYGE